MNNFFVSSFEKRQRINGKESRIKGKNINGHVTMEGIIEGEKFVFDNEPHERGKVFRKTPHPSKAKRRMRKKRRTLRIGGKKK